MKKVLFFVIAAILVQACTNKETGMSDRTKKNSETMNAIIKAIEAKDLSRLDSFMAPDVVENSSMQGRLVGLDNVKADLQQALGHSSEMKTEVIKELADDEYVMSWVRFNGIMAMDQMGLKKGDKFETTAIELAKFNNDSKVTEHWTFMEMGEVMKMMGTPAQMPKDSSNGAKPDSTNK